MKEKTLNNIFKFIFLTFFVIFLTLYISQVTGYYEYEQHQKTVLTEEKIKQFEEDVASGKNIDIKNYLENETKDYNNKASRLGNTVSMQIEKTVKSGMNGLFKILSKMFEE